jgi:hypothetical protein
LIARRHELGDWEWPLLTAEQGRDGERLRHALAQFGGGMPRQPAGVH